MNKHLDVRADQLARHAVVRRRPGSRQVVASAVGEASEVIGSIDELREKCSGSFPDEAINPDTGPGP